MSQYILIGSTGSDPKDEWIRLGTQAQMDSNTLPEPQRGAKLAEAQRHYGQALRLDPRSVIATMNLGIVFAQSNLLNEALLAIERASMFDGTMATVAMNRALMCLAAERIDEAMEAARKAYDLEKTTQTRFTLAIIATTAGHADLSLKLYNEILDTEPAHAVAASNACFVQTLVPGITPKELLEQRQRWYMGQAFTGQKKPTHRPQTNPIKVGYVGGDFKSHSAAMIFGNVVLNHDRAKVETFLYSSLPVDVNADGMSKKFVDHAGKNWRDITALSDEQVDEMIRRDRIDILVDLAGHTNGGRLGIFTRKPAPIQACGWGFAHGTGCPEIDYFFADPVSITEEESKHFAEKIVNLPSQVTYYPPLFETKASSTLPYYLNEYITFGSYARYEKLSDECLRTFAEILRAVPGSKLQFKDHGFRRPYSIRRVLSFMQGIETSRLLFSISTSHPDHMLAHQQADIVLDPFPHSGGVVALEQLYMGVPLITLYGQQLSGRQASSVLTQMGRADWIARTKEEYVAKAVAMAADIPMLAKVRKTLREELMQSPVVKGYVTLVEEAYERMVQAHNAK